MIKGLCIVLISYLFGSIPWALVIGKVFYHKDIRQFGSGNLGASNAGRVLGKPAAVAVTILDAFKAVISMLIAWAVSPDMIPFAGVACCIGHCFPIFAQFKGGKAVATTYGYFLGLAIFVNQAWVWQFIVPVLLFFGILYICRIVSISSLSAIGLEVLISALIIHNPGSVTVCILLLWVFIVYRHKENLKRIKDGTESKVKWMGKLPGEK
ncbi:MAG: glycerol-3-phosphate 1-O-acyltransferase PlsY [Solobacterium sp.]|nr:glycerol-3-phosphate 1-O-acyltransferase PlsY [Solobacterium sp.]